MAVLSGSLKYAVVPAQLLQSSPAEYIQYPKLKSERSEVNRTVISVDDFNRMLERFEPGSPFRYALLIGFYTGLRIGEVFALTWEDIDLKEKTLAINKLVYKRNYGVDVRQVMKQKGKKEEKDEKGNTIHRLIEVEKSVPVTLPKANLIMRRENFLLSVNGNISTIHLQILFVLFFKIPITVS